jgi:hypothetical protein
MTEREIFRIDVTSTVRTDGVTVWDDGGTELGHEQDSQGYRWAIGPQKGPWQRQLRGAVAGLVAKLDEAVKTTGGTGA